VAAPADGPKPAAACGSFKGPLSVQSVIPLVPGAGPLFQQVYLGLRKAILSGAFQGGGRLPSTRELAQELGISRTVVLLAYDQLLAEGFTVGRSGSGTYVSPGVGAARSTPSEEPFRVRLARFGKAATAAWPKVNVPQKRTPVLPYDFAYGRSDVETFPFAMWRRLLLKGARQASASDLDYGPAGGGTDLREAICAHLRRSRAVNCDPTQVIIVNGSQQALDLIARVLLQPGDTVAVEDPSYQGTTEVLRAAATRLRTVSVDAQGLNPAELPRSARAVFVTPSHQFPTGAILPLSRRLALLEWAKRRDAVIVEDDYDGEFRYEGQMLESLQGLDRDSRVIYVGTFSRTVYSALRIGYLVVPKSLVAPFSAAKWLCDRHTPSLEQRTLAEFIASGMYERYLRRLRRRNAARREVLLQSVSKYLHDRVEVTGAAAGAHIVLWSARRVAEDTLIAAAASRGVGIYAMSPYYLKHPARTGVLLGYSRMTENDIQEGIRRLSKVL
jgi:GntR family transcriptional regulator / MocR family aminotransferase